MSGLTEGGTYSYDAYAYPSAIFRHSKPDRMAVLGRLVGLPTPDPATARVLEVAGGDGLNSIALAAAYPDARFVNFDLAVTAIAQGQGWSDTLRQANITHHALDLMDAGDVLEGEFDYIIAHGVYAWVPDFVREAMLPFIAKKLAPGGVAYLSFDCLPASHVRMALRQILQYAGARPDVPPTQRLAIARELLGDLAMRAEEVHEDDHPWHAMIGHTAKQSFEKRDAVLVHDDIGEEYHPQMLADVAREAHSLGLTFLSDALDGRLGELFLPFEAEDVSGPVAEAAILHQAQSNDITAPHFFRRALFTKATTAPTRRLDFEVFEDMWLSARNIRRDDGGNFIGQNRDFQLANAGMAALIGEAVDAHPARLPLAGRITRIEEARGLFALFDADLIGLHAGPLPTVAATLGDSPAASPLARLMCEGEMNFIVALDHNLTTLDEPQLRLLERLDGSRTVEQLRRNAVALGFDDEAALDQTLERFRQLALLAA